MPDSMTLVPPASAGGDETGAGAGGLIRPPRTRVAAVLFTPCPPGAPQSTPRSGTLDRATTVVSSVIQRESSSVRGRLSGLSSSGAVSSSRSRVLDSRTGWRRSRAHGTDCVWPGESVRALAPVTR